MANMVGACCFQACKMIDADASACARSLGMIFALVYLRLVCGYGAAST